MIHLFKDYYLDRDSLQFILKKKSTVKDVNAKHFGEERFEVLGYYPKIDQLIQSAIMKKIKEQDYQTLCEIKLTQDNLIKEFKLEVKVLEKAMEGVK